MIKKERGVVKSFNIIEIQQKKYIGLPGVGLQCHSGERVIRIYYSDGGILNDFNFWSEVKEMRVDPHVYRPKDGMVVVSRYNIPPDRDVAIEVGKFMLRKNFSGWMTPSGEFYLNKSERTASRLRLETICHSLDLPHLQF